MAVSVKTKREIERMRESNHRLEKVFDAMEKMIRPGISTWEIDQAARRLIAEQGGIPNFLDYEGYPAAVCTSVNEEVVHGIPKKERILQGGDIISLDCGLILEGYHSDAARTYAVGRISEREQKLMEVTKQSFFEGIRYARQGYRVSDISAGVQTYAEANGYSVVRDYVGHGVGAKMHEDPEVPNYVQHGRGSPRLLKGMTIAVEPMVNAGGWEIKVLPDGWTVLTADGSLSAHYENSILITDGEPEILTMSDDL